MHRHESNGRQPPPPPLAPPPPLHDPEKKSGGTNTRENFLTKKQQPRHHQMEAKLGWDPSRRFGPLLLAAARFITSHRPSSTVKWSFISSRKIPTDNSTGRRGWRAHSTTVGVSCRKKTMSRVTSFERFVSCSIVSCLFISADD